MVAGPAEETGQRPSVTVVLPVRNEGASIEGVLADVLGQDLAPDDLEVLVVDGLSTDDTRERVARVAAADPRVRLLENPRRLSSAARALGAAEARGRFVAYVDGHCRIPSTTMLSDMVEIFERTGADCLARPQPLEPAAGGLKARAIAAARHSPFGHSLRSEIFGLTEGPVSPVSSGAMYRREVFDRVGNYDPAFDACEDVEFNWRVEAAGLQSVSSPRLAVVYEPRDTWGGLFRQMRRYGLGRARLHRKHPAAFGVESFVPAAFVLGLPLLCAAPWLPSPWSWIVAAPYAVYVLAAALFAALAVAREGASAPALWPLVLLTFPVIHVGLGIGYLLGWILPRPRADGEGGGFQSP